MVVGEIASWASLSVHFSRRGTLLAGQYLYHVKAHASNGSNKGSDFSCGQNFRRKWRQGGYRLWTDASLKIFVIVHVRVRRELYAHIITTSVNVH